MERGEDRRIKTKDVRRKEIRDRNKNHDKRDKI